MSGGRDTTPTAAGSPGNTRPRWFNRAATISPSGSTDTGPSSRFSPLMAGGLYLKQMELGPMQNFVYLIGDAETRDCVAVDPAWESDAILDTAARDGMRLGGVLVTHTHQDHVGGHLFGFDIPGIEELLGRAPAKIYVHKAEREFLKGFGSDVVKVDGGDTVEVGRITVSFIHTPGH